MYERNLKAKRKTKTVELIENLKLMSVRELIVSVNKNQN